MILSYTIGRYYSYLYFWSDSKLVLCPALFKFCCFIGRSEAYT